MEMESPVVPRLAPQHLYVALAAASLPLRLLARNWFLFSSDGSLLGAIRILSCSPAILRLSLMPIRFSSGTASAAADPRFFLRSLARLRVRLLPGAASIAAAAASLAPWGC